MSSLERLSGTALQQQAEWLQQCRALAARDPIFNIIVLADLHPPQLADTDFVLARPDNEVVCLGLAYKGYTPPSIAVSDAPSDDLRRTVLQELHAQFPSWIAWMDSGDEDLFIAGRRVVHAHDEYQMVLATESIPPTPEWVEPLCPEHRKELNAFYSENVAEAWLPAHLDAGPYFCVRRSGRMVSAGGVHFANPYIAQIGNMVTVPEFRRRGFGTAILTAIVRALKDRSKVISMGVVQDNEVAIRLYQRFGFRIARDVKVIETSAR